MGSLVQRCMRKPTETTRPARYVATVYRFILQEVSFTDIYKHGVTPLHWPSEHCRACINLLCYSTPICTFLDSCLIPAHYTACLICWPLLFKQALVIQGEDDGTALVPVEQYLSAREGSKPLGVYALFDAQRNLQYVGYGRNILLAIKVAVVLYAPISLADSFECACHHAHGGMPIAFSSAALAGRASGLHVNCSTQKTLELSNAICRGLCQPAYSEL